MVESAVSRFHRHFPNGFRDPEYLRRERSYKWEAHERFLETLGGGKGRALLKNGKTEDVVDRALKVLVPRTKDQYLLLYSKELMAFRDGLRASSAAANRYFEALFDLLDQEGVGQERFEHCIAAVESLPADEGKSSPVKWPVLTVLPFLADPMRFMFLKPKVTKDVATLMGFPWHYRTALNWQTYEELLKMARLLLTRLGSLGARDFIDVQSFIWALRYV